MTDLNHGRAARKSWVRRIVQLGFFVFVLLLALSHTLKRQGVDLPFSTANLHALCPFGAAETAGRLLTQGEFIPKTRPSNLWVFLGVAASTALVGAVFCGWLCPLGSIQDLIGKLGRRLFPRRYNRIPRRLDRALGLLRYAVLALVVVQTTRLLSLVFSMVDPYYALFHFWTGQVLPSALVILGLVLAASLLVERPWCRWLCPLGAILGLLQILSPWTIRRRESGEPVVRSGSACIACGRCSRACPLGIEVAATRAVRDPRCNRCGECLAACPVPGALEHSLPRRSLSLRNRWVTAALVLAFFASPILIAGRVGLFQTGRQAGVATGALAPENIKGTMTLQELALGFDTELPALLRYLGLPEHLDPAIRLMDLEDTIEGLTPRVIRTRMEAYPAAG